MSEAQNKFAVPRRRAPTSGGFKPGQSGNPGGRPKAVVEVQHLARAETVGSIRALVRVRDDKKAPPAAVVAAATALLDRGWGRPKQEIETTGNATIELHLVAARVISQELLQSADAPPVIEHAAVTSDALDVPTE
jgi:hypothetical protein